MRSELPTRVSIAIAAHPARYAYAEELAQSCSRLSPVICLDPNPHGGPSAARAAAEAWRAVEASSTHHVVIQDDVEVCNGFEATLERVISLRPRDIISLFVVWTGRAAQYARIAASIGASWFTVSPDLVSVQAIAMPADLAREYGEFLAQRITSDRGDSSLFREFVRSKGASVACVVPSIVQHDSRGISSILPALYPKPVRRAACYLRDPIQDEEIDLEALAPLVYVPVLSSFDFRGYLLGDDDRYGSFDSLIWARLSRLGLSQGAFDRLVNAVDVHPDLQDVLSNQFISEIAAVGIGMGLITRQVLGGRNRRTSHGSRQRCQAVALRTMVPGALARLLSERTCGALANPSAQFLDDLMKLAALMAL